MLKRRGVELADEQLPTEFLMEQLELREEIEAARASSDRTTAIESLRKTVERDVERDEARLVEALEANDNDAACIATLRLRYWSRALNALDADNEDEQQ